MSGNRIWHGRGRGRSRGYNTGAGSRQEKSSSGMNPVDKDGKVMKCFRCGSSYHFSRFCPSKRYDDSDIKQPKEVHITLFSARSDGKARGLVKAVCGATWLNMYLDTLHGDDKALVEVLYSYTKFRFGDGVEVTSSKLVKIPALIGHKKVMIYRCGA